MQYSNINKTIKVYRLKSFHHVNNSNLFLWNLALIKEVSDLLKVLENFCGRNAPQNLQFLAGLKTQNYMIADHTYISCYAYINFILYVPDLITEIPFS